MRGDKNLRRAGKGAAASKAWDAFTSGPEGADPATTAAEHVAGQGGKDVAGNAAKEAWHTAPWESAKAAFGAKGAAVLAAVGGAAAVGLVAVATVAVAGGGGGDKGGDDVEISSGGKDGDREIGSGGKDGDDDTSTTGDDDTTTSSTASSTTTSTSPGQPTTTARSSTPGGPNPTDPTGTTRPPGVTTTRPTTTTSTTRPVPPKIDRFTSSPNPNSPCRDLKLIPVMLIWSSTGGATAKLSDGTTTLTNLKPSGQQPVCTHHRHTWTLTVTAANNTSASASHTVP